MPECKKCGYIATERGDMTRHINLEHRVYHPMKKKPSAAAHKPSVSAKPASRKALVKLARKKALGRRSVYGGLQNGVAALLSDLSLFADQLREEIKFHDSTIIALREQIAQHENDAARLRRLHNAVHEEPNVDVEVHERVA